jgi:hypothetical protein
MKELKLKELLMTALQDLLGQLLYCDLLAVGTTALHWKGRKGRELRE